MYEIESSTYLILLGPKPLIECLMGILGIAFKHSPINQPHLTDFAPFQSTRTQHSSQVLDVVSAVAGCVFEGYAIIEYKWIR